MKLLHVNKQTWFLFLLLLIGSACFGQSNDERLIHGKIISDGVSVEGINVVNLVNEKYTTTDINGEFYILAKTDDLLVLTAINFEYTRKLLDERDLESSIITIKMIPNITPLNEVIINQYPNINAEELGIIGKGQKKYTPAERKLYTAQSGPVDIIANIISGRTAMLKKEVEVEKKEMLLARLEIQFEDQLYTENMKIPSDHIRGFQHFLIEDAEFVAALKAKNRTMMRFIMARKAETYNQTLKTE